WVASHFSGRAWIGVSLLRGCDDTQRLAQLTHIGAQLQLPLMALGDVHMHLRERTPLPDLPTATRCRLPLALEGSRLNPNAERHLRSRERLAHIYPPALLAETLVIAARCRFSLAEIRYQYPEELVPAGETPTSWLRKLTWEGATRRYPAGLPDKVHK